MRPMGQFLDTLDVEAVNTVGIRAEESNERAKLTEWEDASGMIDAEVWRPLLAWTMDDVVAIHQRHGVTPNRGYFAGAARVGCWPCIRSRKKEIRDLDPDRIGIIRDLEAVIAELASARYALIGETFESLGYAPPTFFQAFLKDEGKKWPIDKVMNWSRTAHGGRQVELFAAKPHEMGCMRWGMCDMPAGEK